MQQGMYGTAQSARGGIPSWLGITGWVIALAMGGAWWWSGQMAEAETIPLKDQISSLRAELVDSKKALQACKAPKPASKLTPRQEAERYFFGQTREESAASRDKMTRHLQALLDAYDKEGD